MYKKTMKQEKENLSNGLISEELIYACLMTCEKVISKNAYLEKKWGKRYEGLTGSADASNYTQIDSHGWSIERNYNPCCWINIL